MKKSLSCDIYKSRHRNLLERFRCLGGRVLVALCTPILPQRGF
jgi:hypothetical protein